MNKEEKLEVEKELGIEEEEEGEEGYRKYSFNKLCDSWHILKMLCNIRSETCWEIEIRLVLSCNDCIEYQLG